MEKKTFIGKKLKKYKNTLVLNQTQRNLIIGTLLGDSSMEYRLGKPVYALKFEQSIKNTEYINHIYSIIEPFVGMIPKIRIIKSTDNDKERKSIWFRTYKHDSLKFYFDLFYKIENNKLKKVVPKNLHKFLNAEVLAYWYMDDGTYADSGFVLNTQGFTYKENQELIFVLEKSFNFSNLSLWKDKNFYKIYISVSNKEKFITIIKPYILPIFLYKLGL